MVHVGDNRISMEPTNAIPTRSFYYKDPATVTTVPPSPRGLPLKITQRLRRGELVTTIRTQTSGGQEVNAGYRGPLTASAIAMLLRVMARKVEKSAGELV